MSYRTPDRDESKEAVPETVTPTMAESATADGTLEVASESATRISTAKKEADAVMAEMTESFDRELLPQTRMTFRRITELCLSKADRDAQSTNPDAVAEKLLNIKTARLDWQGFTEIDSLEALTNIRELHLQFNRIRRIENLDFHMRLRFLALGHNEIEHIENLVHLRSLEVLDLNHNRIEVLDLTALPPSLRNLDLRGNPCTSVSEYQSRICAKMPQLVYLDAIAIRNERKSMDRSGGDQRDQELEERVELKPLRSARSGPPSATHRSDALMEAALARIDELSRSASLRAHESFSEKRRGLVERSRARMAESERAFADRVVPTMENTLPAEIRENHLSKSSTSKEAPTSNQEQKEERQANKETKSTIPA